MIRKAVLATDFSTRSDRALRRATIEAKQDGASLTLVYVVDDDQPQHLIDAQTGAAWSLLEDFVRTIRDHDGVTAEAKVVAGDIYAGILRVAEDVAADLVIVGPHRRQFRDVFVGTTAERTIAHSQHPVLMTAGTPSASYGRILVALDLDEPSRSLASRVGELGITERGEIVAMHAFDAPAQGMMRRAMSDKAAIDHYVAGEARRASAAFGAFVAGTGLASARQSVRPVNGSPARTILECARAEDADLIVVGTGRKQGVGRFMLGSVAEDLLGETDRDVLVIPA